MGIWVCNLNLLRQTRWDSRNLSGSHAGRNKRCTILGQIRRTKAIRTWDRSLHASLSPLAFFPTRTTKWGVAVVKYSMKAFKEWNKISTGQMSHSTQLPIGIKKAVELSSRCSSNSKRKGGELGMWEAIVIKFMTSCKTSTGKRISSIQSCRT